MDEWYFSPQYIWWAGPVLVAILEKAMQYITCNLPVDSVSQQSPNSLIAPQHHDSTCFVIGNDYLHGGRFITNSFVKLQMTQSPL